MSRAVVAGTQADRIATLPRRCTASLTGPRTFTIQGTVRRGNATPLRLHPQSCPCASTGFPRACRGNLRLNAQIIGPECLPDTGPSIAHFDTRVSHRRTRELDACLRFTRRNRKRALHSAAPVFFLIFQNQYFRVSPFCREKYVVRSSMSASDNACTWPLMMGFLRAPLLYSCRAWRR